MSCKSLFIIFLFLFFNVVNSQVVLVAKKGEKRRIDRAIIVDQSIYIRNMLEEQEDEGEDIEIPLPNVENSDLPDIATLMERAYGLKKENIRLFEIKERLFDEIKNIVTDFNKLVSLMKAANYINAYVVLKALSFYFVKENKVITLTEFKALGNMGHEVAKQYRMLFGKTINIVGLQDAIGKEVVIPKKDIITLVGQLEKKVNKKFKKDLKQFLEYKNRFDMVFPFYEYHTEQKGLFKKRSTVVLKSKEIVAQDITLSDLLVEGYIDYPPLNALENAYRQKHGHLKYLSEDEAERQRKEWLETKQLREDLKEPKYVSEASKIRDYFNSLSEEDLVKIYIEYPEKIIGIPKIVLKRKFKDLISGYVKGRAHLENFGSWFDRAKRVPKFVEYIAMAVYDIAKERVGNRDVKKFFNSLQEGLLKMAIRREYSSRNAENIDGIEAKDLEPYILYELVDDEMSLSLDGLEDKNLDFSNTNLNVQKALDLSLYFILPSYKYILKGKKYIVWNFKKSGLQRIPEALRYSKTFYKKLHTLNLSKNKLRSLPVWFADRCENLKSLNITGLELDEKGRKIAKQLANKGVLVTGLQ